MPDEAPGPTTDAPVKRPSPRRRWPRWLALGAAVLIAAPSAAWIAAPLDWRIDLAGNFAAHLLVPVLASAVLWTVLRCRAAAAVAWLSVVVLVWPLATGRAPTASRAPDLRLLVYNPLVTNRGPGDAISVVRNSGADVVALVEPPQALIEECVEGGSLRSIYPYMVHRPWEWGPLSSFQMILSRWPLERPDARPLEEPISGIIRVIADVPGGTVGFVVVQPRSPRTLQRWREGLDEADRAAEAVRRLASGGWPVIVLGDFNSTPSGLLSRRLCSRAGLRRCKPWLLARGTFPAARRWPMTVAIDDALVSAGMAVTSWTTLEAGGSDHSPVMVGIALPRDRGPSFGRTRPTATLPPQREDAESWRARVTER